MYSWPVVNEPLQYSLQGPFQWLPAAFCSTHLHFAELIHGILIAQLVRHW